MDMDRRIYGRGRRGRAKDISDRVPQGEDKGVSSGRIPGKGRDKDGDEAAFMETACKGRHDHIGGRKPPSSKMPTMQHASPVVVSKWPSQEHINVQEWGREEETATCVGGVKRQRGDGLRGLWEQLQAVPSFKYLGRILAEGDDDWPAVARNLGKARKSWGRLQGILSREGATKRVSGNFLKAVVQQVILFRADT